MNRSLISLYVLLTTRLPIPWSLLARATGILLGFMAAVAMGPDFVAPLNIAVAMGLASTAWLRLPQVWSRRKQRNSGVEFITVAVLIAALMAVCLFLPPIILQFAVSVGLMTMGCLYLLVLLTCSDMLDRLGYNLDQWGVEGQANAIRWQVLRCAGLSVANAYTTIYFEQHEWVVAHAALPLIFYLLYHWSVIATHPYEEDQ